MSIRTLVGGCSAITALLLVSAAHAQITPLPRSAKFSWSVDGRSLQSIPIDGSMLPNGQVKYEGTVLTQEGVQLTLTYTADVTNNPTATVSGQFKCTNFTGGSHGIEAVANFPLCPIIPGGTLFGGAVTLLATANAAGGSITCLPGADSIWQPMVDGSPVYSIFYCPFVMQTTGSGTMQSTQVFGAPIPGFVGPNTAATAGSRNRFTISKGDQLSINSTVVVKSLGVPTWCVGDLNYDGKVNSADLAIVLGDWGPASMPCAPADLDGSGVIDSGDVTVLLGKWGSCPG